MLKIAQKVKVNNRFMAFIATIKDVPVDNIYTDGKRYLVQYLDGNGSDYMSISSLELVNEQD